MMKKTFTYFFKKDYIVWILLSVIIFISGPFLTFFVSANQLALYYGQLLTPFVSILISALACALIIPLYMNSYIYKKNQIDVIYALPVSRKTYTISNYLNGLTYLMSSFILNFLLAILIVFIKEPRIHTGPLFIIFAIDLLAIFMVYTIVFYVTFKANTLVDALVGTLMVLFVPTLAVLLFAMPIIPQYFYYFRLPPFVTKTVFDLTALTIPSFAVGMTHRVIEAARYPSTFVHYNHEYLSNPITIIALVANLALFTYSIVGVFHLSRNDKGERSGQRTEAIVSSRFFLPIVSAFFMKLFMYLFISNELGSLFLVFVFLVVYLIVHYLLQAARERTFKISKRTLLIDGIFLVSGLLLGVLEGVLYQQFR